MSAPSELANVLARRAVARLVEEHARLAHCRVGVFGEGGDPIQAEGELRAARPSGLNGSVRVDGLNGHGAVCAVTAFDRVLGYVVASGDGGEPGRAGGPQSVADHSAAILGELCSREYELNDLSREILGSYEELNLFYDLAAEMAGAPNADAICRVALATACRVIPAANAWILLADGPRGALRVAASRESVVVGSLVQAGAGRAGAILASRAAEPVDDVRQLDRSGLTLLERTAQRSLVTLALCVPGRDGQPAVGVMQLCDKQGGAFTAGDLKLAQAIASHAAVLIQNSRLIGLERELLIARTIQQSLLPGAPPRVPGIDVAGVCIPASNVGGDYYDHILAGPTSLVFLVADVSGHNLAAALLQTAARAAFRAAALTDPAPGGVLRRASRTLHNDLSRAELFLTAWFGCVDAATGRLSYSDAGHNPSVLYRAATRQTSWLATGGIPIGVMDEAVFDEGSVLLERGDVVVAYTDGLTEASAPGAEAVQYGEDRLAVTIARAAHLPAEGIVRALLDDVARFCGGHPAGDDRSVVVLRYLGPAA